MRHYLEKPFTKIGLVEWLKVKALDSNSSTTKKKKLWQNMHNNSIYQVCNLNFYFIFHLFIFVVLGLNLGPTP
jgi:hypothetical protein